MTRREGTEPWRVAVYIRLSREDGNDESESVVNQRRILFAALADIFAGEAYEVAGVYVDDGASGTTDDERAAFRRMTEDVRAGRVNCIVVKNLSRAFRNSANQGKFLEEFLPLHRARFISLYGPSMDSYRDPEAVHSLEVGITGFLNEQYAYKVSCDVRRTLGLKRQRGEYVGAFAPYGYRKHPDDKNRLVVDEEAAEVVRGIYRRYLSGMSKAGIARSLNEAGIPNPTAYKLSCGVRYRGAPSLANDGLWGPKTVSDILRNPIYAGTLAQGRTRAVSYKVHRRAPVPEAEWCVVADAVPPVVGAEEFRAAQALRERVVRTPPGKREPHLFAGFVRCAACGKGMARRSAKGHSYYACRTYAEKSKTRCSGRSVSAERLETAVLVSLRLLLALSGALPPLLEEAQKAGGAGRRRAQSGRGRLAGELERTEAVLDSLYVDWRAGELTEERYRRLNTQYRERRERLLSALSAAEDAAPEEDPYLAALLHSRALEGLSRGLLLAVLDGVRVHEGGAVDLAFACRDPFLADA